MKVGTICKLKVDCLGNEAGTLGVVFYEYGDGFQVIFENGKYDGFSSTRRMPSHLPSQAKIEADYFLEEVGFEESLAGYQFKNVSQVSEDYRNGLFNIAWGKKESAPTLLDCCKRYIRQIEETYASMGRKPSNTTYLMMKEAVAEAEKK